MAKNYSVKEAAEIIAGNDKELLVEVAKRFPLLALSISKNVEVLGDTFMEFVNAIPENVSAAKVNKIMVGDVNTEATTEEQEVVETVEVKTDKVEKASKTPKAPKAEKVESSSTKLSVKEIWNLLGEKGLRKDCKEQMGGVKAGQIQEYYDKYVVGKAVSADVEAEEIDEEVAEEVNAGKYAGKSAVELFKLCKARKIKIAPKKSEAEYIALLEADDAKSEAAQNVDTATDEEDDWEI